MTNSETKALLVETARRFCTEFLDYPYLAYTEHGLHALFFSRILAALPESSRYSDWQDKRFCVVQKEYPTATDLDKAKRQHWDIAVIRTPPSSHRDANSFDYLRLFAVFEFGMNASREHLREDIRRLAHSGANLDNGFALHFHRLCKPGRGLSGRDWSSDSKAVCTREEAQEILGDSPVTLFYVMADPTGTHPNGLWEIDAQNVKKLA